MYLTSSWQMILKHSLEVLLLPSSPSIHNVLYVSKAPFNLLSNNKFTRSIDCVILTHPSLEKLKQLTPNLSKLEYLFCDSCQFGKHILSPFSSCTFSHALSPFVLVHLDVWDPSCFPFTLGLRYCYFN